ncbi:hydroxysteroid dehydrogenase-like protein 2 [Dysidea avara]|uniref:hydroxysteroid dehydrogenase-like protein 2 n=1 Tax=Dysidea avara TaxID=196820 RepID=UPI00332CF126
MNTGALAGRTLFITGASRGIGKAIAIKAARDGANVVIAAKTADPHPKLPGTIYTAAKEVEDAGGKCLPCVVDIRFEDQVSRAIEQAVEKFGGIDVLVNNASAISITGTVSTEMKRYDLMMGINARGTFLTSKLCIPYLKKGRNPHILNISPPLNMKPRWFRDHCAYTMAKYGMSMCVLGMSEELKPDGIAVNALWPRTAIATAAMEMLAGDEGMKMSRSPDIMADAAYAILQHTCDQMTGQFLIDDDVVKKAGITDLDQYANSPGSKLLPDYFLDEAELMDIHKQFKESSKDKAHSPKAIFEGLAHYITPDIVKSTQCTFLFEVDGDLWLLDLKNGDGSMQQVSDDASYDVKMTMKEDIMVELFTGKQKAAAAYMTGKLKIKGDLGKAMKLEKLMSQLQVKKSKL